MEQMPQIIYKKRSFWSQAALGISLVMITCTISPMRMDGHYGDLIIDIAKAGIPVVCPAEPLCGATSPVTLAGNVAVQTVDSLIGIMLTQIVNPGTPAIPPDDSSPRTGGGRS